MHAHEVCNPFNRKAFTYELTDLLLIEDYPRTSKLSAHVSCITVGPSGPLSMAAQMDFLLSSGARLTCWPLIHLA